MTSICTPAALRLPVDTTSKATRSISWTARRHTFELSSADAEVIDMAMRVFPGAVEDVAASVSLRWDVELARDSDSPSDECRKALVGIEYQVLEFVIANSPDVIEVHAALLSRNAKGVLIVGPSLAGKSTLSTALWRSGWTLMADDVAFIDPETRSASPAPRRVSLRTESKELVGETLWNDIARTESCLQTAKGLCFHPHEVHHQERLESTSLDAIFFLARRGVVVGPAETSLINPARAALSLVPYSLNVRELPFMDGLRRVSPVCEVVPSYDLGRGDLRAMIDAVEECVG